MTLILSNEEIEQILSMEDLVAASEEAYLELIEGRGAIRLRSDLYHLPTELRRIQPAPVPSACGPAQ